MDFSLSEEQSLLRDSAGKYLGDNYDFLQRREIVAGESGFSPAHWQAFAEFGWLGVPFDEAVGGFGGRVEDVAVLCEAMGRALVVEPYIANVVLAGRLLTEGGQAARLGAMIDGTKQYAFAATERHGRQDPFYIETRATESDGGFVIDGSKALAANGAHADAVIFAARHTGTADARDGISIFVVDTDAPGISRDAIRLMDGSLAANFRFDGVRLDRDALVGEAGQGAGLIATVVCEARIAIAAESLGIMDALREKTVEYARTREQFGVPIGSFQALQHRMVDMFVAVEQTRSMLYRGICAYQQGETDVAATLAAMKALVGRNARLVGEEAIQLHGGMGMTDELDIGHYVKRLMMLSQWFGDSDSALREYSAASIAA